MSPSPKPRQIGPVIPPVFPAPAQATPAQLSSDAPVQGKSSWEPVATLAVLAAIALVGVVDMPAMFWGGDPAIWREEARSLLKHHRLAVDPAVVPAAGEKGQSLIQNTRDGQFYSKYGLMNSLMALPPMWLDLVLLGGSSAPLTSPKLLFANLWNVALGVMLAAVLLRLAALYTERFATRLAFVIATFYGTYLWYYLRAQSSEIYQTLFFALAFLMLVKFLRSVESGRTSLWRIHLAWLLVGMLVFTRILNLLLVPLLVIYVFTALMRVDSRQRAAVAWRLLPHFLAPPVLIVAVLGMINFMKFGSPLLSGYHQWQPENHLPSGPISQGLWGLLFMPRFSILLYFPVLPFALLQVRSMARRFPVDALAAFGTGVAFLVLLSKIPTWAGEWTYGPRYFLFALPVAGLPFILLVDWLIDRRSRMIAWVIGAVVCGALLYSAYLQFRVNRVHFWAYYAVRLQVEPNWPPSAADYFLNRHVGVITDELLRHRADLDAFGWFADLKRGWSEEQTLQHRQSILGIMSTGNHYWFDPRHEPVQ